MSKTELQLEWRRIAEFKASGLSAPKWCAANNIKPHQLYYWLRKEKTKLLEMATSTAGWLPISIGQETPSETMVVKIGAATIVVTPDFNPSLFAKVVRTLTDLC